MQTVSLMSGYVVAGLFWGAFAASTPDLQAISGLGTGGFGFILLAMTAGAFPVMMLLGRLMHRVQIWAMPGCLLAFALAALLGVPAFAVVALSGHWPIVLLAFLLAGVAVGPIEPTVFRLVAGRYGQAERGRVLSAVTAVAYIGYLVSPPILGGIAENAGWEAMWGTTAMVAAGVVLLTVQLVRLERRLPAVARAG